MFVILLCCQERRANEQMAYDCELPFRSLFVSLLEARTIAEDQIVYNFEVPSKSLYFFTL